MPLPRMPASTAREPVPPILKNNTHLLSALLLAGAAATCEAHVPGAAALPGHPIRAGAPLKLDGALLEPA